MIIYLKNNERKKEQNKMQNIFTSIYKKFR